MTEESQLKTELVKQCKSVGWYARRIEDQFAVGVLDIHIVPPGFQTLFIEAKIVDGMVFRPTERQFVEGLRIIEAKGLAIPVLIGWRNKIMYIADWGREAYITRAFRQPDGMNYVQALGVWMYGKQRSD